MDKKNVIYKCSHCKEIGHNVRTCSKKKRGGEMDFISQISNLEMIWRVIRRFRREENDKMIEMYDVHLDLEAYKKSNYDEKFNILNNPDFTLINAKKPILRDDNTSYGAACYEK